MLGVGGGGGEGLRSVLRTALVFAVFQSRGSAFVKGDGEAGGSPGVGLNSRLPLRA